jgi:hypothetical protein
MQNNSAASPVCESTYHPEDPESAWPEGLKLSPDLIAVFTPRRCKTRRGIRHVAVLGRFKDGQPYILFSLAYEKKNGSYTFRRHGTRFTLPQFRQLCLKFGEILRSNPELGEVQPAGEAV